MSEDDVPTVVFAGAYEEALFLKTLIESAGIQTTLDALPYSRGTVPTSKIYVRRADADVAGELVEDFRVNGHRSKK